MKRIILLLLLLSCCTVVFAQTYRVGDVYTAPDGSRGIVYYLHPDGSGGWVVALTDVGRCWWGPALNPDVPGLPNQNPIYLQQLLYDTAGYANTLALRNFQNNDPTYAAGQVDFAHGWVLPSPAQLSMLHGQRAFISSAIVAAGGTNLVNDWYWSSAEKDASNAWRLNFGTMYGSGSFESYPKTAAWYVRAVRNFTYQKEPDMSFHWSTGDTTASITVAPSETTNYTVAVSIAGGHNDAEEYSIVVNSPVTSTSTVTACESYTWHDSTYTEDGTYLYSHSNDGVCGVDTLHLTIYHATSITIDTVICVASLPYTWHNHVFTQADSYNDTVLNADGCDHVITYQLHVSAPAVTIQNITSINCYGASTGGVSVFVSDGVQPYSCHWENAAGTTVSSVAQLSNQPAGVYYLYVEDALGCQVLNSVTLTHLNDSMVPGVIANDQSVCAGHQPSAFTGTLATGGASSTYQWQVSTDGTNWTPAPIPNNTRNYTYPNAVNAPISLRRAWISTACGTVYSNIVTVNVLQNYSDTITASVCQGYPYQGNGFNISAEATASPGTITSLVHLQTESGCDSMVTLLLTVQPSTYSEEQLMICKNELPFTYNDTVFDVTTPQFSTVNFQFTTAGGCDSVVVLHLTVNPMYEQDLNDMICEGESYNQNGFVVSSAQTQGLTELDLTQQLQSYVGCDSVVNLHLTIVDDAISIVSLTDDFCEEYVAELSVESHLQNYMWSTGETSQTITVTRTGVYTVTASEGQCSVSVSYQIEACELNVYLPNAITPGLGDGINDYFCIHDQYKPMIEDFEIRIYSRWGELVYYSKDKDFKWNGEIKGRIIRQVIYTYMITFTDSRGIPYQLTGSITVL